MRCVIIFDFKRYRLMQRVYSIQQLTIYLTIISIY